METLQSFVEDRWYSGQSRSVDLIDPSTESIVAQTSTDGIDYAGMLAFGRQHGGPALRAMTFAERGEMLRTLADAVVAARPQLLEMSMRNNGATRSDAKFDVDGASFALAAYAEIGAQLGDRRYLVDGEAQELLRSRKLGGLHVKLPRPGVAVHVNAFNFPAWGLAEKAAVSWLAGMPVVTKPATATAYTAWGLVKALLDTQALPKGALGFIAGSAGDLLDRLQMGDALAFTGSSAVGQMFRMHPNIAAQGIPVNVEADSVNSAVLGPDVEPGDDVWDMIVRDVFREMTQKTGQKCTAVRRVMVPVEQVDAFIDDLVDNASRLKVGSPFAEGVRMGPVVSERQLQDVMSGIERLRQQTVLVHGSGRPQALHGVEDGKGFFVDCHVFKTADPEASMRASVVHDHEVFGPALTVLPYDGTAQGAANLVARGKGSLVTAVYSDDRRWTQEAVLSLAPYNGRVVLGSARIADSAPGPGAVLPQLVHGGPGRAGGGEELGGLRGMDFYLQRTALQGYRPLLERLFDGG